MAVLDRYDFLNNTYISKSKEYEMEIGDSMQPDFEPQVKLKRWNNECNFSMRLIGFDKADAILSTDGDTVINESADIILRFIDNEEKNFHYETVLKTKPPSNVIQYSIRTKGLRFNYQPELTQKEILDGATRPEKVVGSYAVYHTAKKGNSSHGTYKTGKAFHLYRSRVIDANLNRTWVEMNIDTQAELMTIIIPSAFYNNAVYPVVIR